MTILTTADICKMTAAITGGDVKRAATKEAAILRLRKIAADKGMDADAILSGAPVDEPTPEPVAAPSHRRAALDLIEAETPAPEVVKPRKVRAAKPKPEPKAKGPSKRDVILDMACRKQGATEQEICEEIGWKACLVTLRRAAEAAGVTLRVEKAKGERSRYFGSRA